jgi:pimeloyl-ACP methyl ester carboxylesterase
MATSFKSVVLLALLAALWCSEVHADKKTVCTITVNSSDEKEIFRQRLPKDKFQFVELVERGRPDWLASACQKGVQCDVLVISGHFAGTNFFSEALDTQEFLPVDELERVSCSDSCPGLFSRLKEVYLFGCNTLNGEAIESDAAGIARAVDHPSRSRADSDRQPRVADARHGETSRDRMRRIFSDVPVIYGFSSKAPVGQTAAGMLGRYFQTAAASEIGSGRISSRLLGQFAATSMHAASGMRDSDPQAGYRDEVCRFFDQRLAPAQKLDFIHQILLRNAAEVRTFFDRIEKFSTSVSPEDRQAPAFVAKLDQIGSDGVARDRYLALVRGTERPAIRARMVRLAGALGWLSPEDQQSELVRVVTDVLAGNAMGSAEVELVPEVLRQHEGALERVALVADLLDPLGKFDRRDLAELLQAAQRFLQALEIHHRDFARGGPNHLVPGGDFGSHVVLRFPRSSKQMGGQAIQLSDQIVAPGYAEAFRDLIPGARLETIPEAGHHPELEQPEGVVERIGRFMREDVPS